MRQAACPWAHHELRVLSVMKTFFARYADHHPHRSCPSAQAIALGLKRIETRSWATRHRGPVAIHAASRPLPDMTCWQDIFPSIAPDAFPRSAMVAITSVEDCVEMTPDFINNLSATERALGIYAPGRFAWILGPVTRLAPIIPASGHQGLWNWPGMC